MEQTKTQAFRTFCRKVSRIMTSRTASLVWLVLATVLLRIGDPVAGASTLIAGIILLLVFSDNVLTTTLPFLLVCVYVLPNYNSYELFIPYWWLAIPTVSALVFHFIFFHRPWKIGSTFWGVLAVAVAITTAGLFSHATFTPTVLFYTVFLGVGMVAVYLLLSSDLSGGDDLDISRIFPDIMMTVGIFCCLLIGKLWLDRWPVEDIKHFEFQPSNNLGTMLLFALPFPLFGVYRAKGLRKVFPALLFVLFFAALLLTTSRGALVMAPVLVIISFILLIIVDSPNRWKWCIAAVLGIGVCAAMMAGIRNAYELGDREINWLKDVSRLRLIRASILDFLQYPVFGVGLAGSRNTNAYHPVAGAMCWYHMMIPQIIGSMGLCGVVAYGYQLFGRLRTYLSRINVFSSVLLLSYFGVFLMSQVNPGEFCPLPYELLAVMLFVLMEKIPKEASEHEKDMQ